MRKFWLSSVLLPLLFSSVGYANGPAISQAKPVLPVTSSRQVIGMYQPSNGAWPQSIESGLAARLTTAGFKPVHLSVAQLTNPAILNGHVLPVLILINPAMIPAQAVKAVQHYAQSAGFLVALGGPAFTNMEFRSGAAWFTQSQMLRRIKRIIHGNPLSLPRQSAQWAEASLVPTAPSMMKVLTKPHQLPAGVAYGYQFHFLLNGWCNFTYRGPKVLVPAGNQWTVFWAKGDQHGRQLDIEWDERDGSRWIGVVNLHTHWTRYVMPEIAFQGWPHPAVAGRFFPGDHLHLKHATTISFGLANGFTSETNGRRYTIDVAGVGTAAPRTKGSHAYAAALQAKFHAAPVIRIISPAYKLFPVTDMCTLAVNERQAIAPQATLPTPASALGLYPRAQATGINKDMATRYIPLLNALGNNGRFAAIAAALELPSTGAVAGQATILSVPVTDGSFFAAPATQRWLARVIRRVHRGVYLAEGGTKQYAAFAPIAMPVGAVVLNRGTAPQAVRVVSTVTAANGKIAFQHIFSGTVRPGGARKFAAVWTPPTPRRWQHFYRVATTLEIAKSGAEKVIDRLVGSCRVLRTWRQHHFVTAKNGLFYLRGKPWYVMGVNFWPESSMAQESWPLFLNWCSRQSYDPQTVERNLREVKAIGFNTISVAFGKGDDPWNLLDVLACARKLGLHVNLSIAGIDALGGEAGGPGKFDFRPVKKLIAELHLASNATVFAYDIAWEPHWGHHIARQRLDAQWRAWIIHHYGSIKKAQEAWHFRAPRWQGHVTNPLDRQIGPGRHGQAAAMVLAYNHFLNEMEAHIYGRATRLIHSIDPRHLVSFRMSDAGNPYEPPDVCYDFTGLGHAVDIFEPEGYSLMRESLRTARMAVFTIQYARVINPDLPVIYAEFGASEWNVAKDADSYAAAKRIGEIYAGFYHTILAAGCNGAICWWFPGGYRCDERSDYGIINPDGSWRPVTYVIHKFAVRMKAPRPLPIPQVWIPMQLNHVRAEMGVYESVKKKFWAVYDAGKLPGLKVLPAQAATAKSKPH